MELNNTLSDAPELGSGKQIVDFFDLQISGDHWLEETQQEKNDNKKTKYVSFMS